jgi:hypothetical protein
LQKWIGLLQNPGDVDGHRRVGDALGPAVPADGGAAHHLKLQPQLLGRAHHPARRCGSHWVLAGSGSRLRRSSAFPPGSRRASQRPRRCGSRWARQQRGPQAPAGPGSEAAMSTATSIEWSKDRRAAILADLRPAPPAAAIPA